MSRLPAAALALALSACLPPDDGMIDGVCGPVVRPLDVVNLGVDPDVLDAALDLWNDAAAPAALFALVDEPTTWDAGWITLDVLPLPASLPDEVAGTAALEWNALGEVTRCEISISPDWTWERRMYTRTVAHELGHCLGLADDVESLDLGSIMSSPPHTGARPTDADVALVLAGCAP